MKILDPVMTQCLGFVQSCSLQFVRSYLEILQARLYKHNKKIWSDAAIGESR
jgi:hypothetical protein